MELYNLDKKKFEANVGRMNRLLDNERNVVVKVTWPSLSGNNQVLFYEDYEKELEHYVKNYNINAEAADRGFDNLPYFRVDFGRVAYLMSIAYDCEMVMINNLINAKPRIIEDIDEIYKIKKKENIHECGLYPEITKRMQLIEKRFGDVPFVPSDVQSPIDVLTEIVKSDTCMYAMFDDKEPLHYLLEILTESIRELCLYQGSVVKNWIGYGHDYPLPRGIHLSDDNAAFLSPATYEEFALPYNSRLGRYFNGVTLHCCMGQKQNMKLMSSTENFLGFDPQITYNPAEEIFEAVSGKSFLRVWNIPKDKDPFETYKWLIDSTEGKCGLLMEISGPSRDEALRLGERVKEYAASRGRK